MSGFREDIRRLCEHWYRRGEGTAPMAEMLRREADVLDYVRLMMYGPEPTDGGKKRKKGKT